jgi:peptidoglycan hydrolase-like protein with peptidoglycan-binding domain
MDIRAILNKLDEVVLSEALSLDDVEAAVKGKETDEQARAEILNDLAWKHKLPGLYDPISGGFVGKQGVNQGMGGPGRISIGATGSERSDRALADLGLIPDNAKTSTALGRAFRGDDKGQYDQDLRTRSQGAVAQQKYEKFKTENLPKLKDLASQLGAAVEKMKAGGSGTGSGGFFGLDASKFRRESKIYESLMNEFQDEILDADLEEVAVEPGSQDIKSLIDQLNNIILQFDSQAEFLKRDPETQKELNTIRPQIADAVNAVKAAQDKAKADAEKKTPSPYDLVPPEEKKKFPADYNKDGSQKSKEERLARLKELLAKANQPKVGSPAPGTNVGVRAESVQAESMSELMARIQRIAEGTATLSEELTKAEYQELQTIAAGLKQEFGDDPEIAQISNRALNLPAVWSSDEKPSVTTTNPDEKKSDEKKSDEKKPGVSDPKIKKIQEQLIALGIPLPKYGADGKMGDETVNAIKAFQKMAGVKEDGKITPELEKLLADGKNIIARSQLVQSMAAVEKILAKYKISESVTLEDLDLMSENELRSFVMANIKVFSESEQMSILKQYITESDEDTFLAEAFKLGGENWTVVSKNTMTGEVILKSAAGKTQSSTELMKLFPGEMERLKTLEKNVAKSTRVPVTGEVDPRKVQGTGSVKDLGATEKDLKNIRDRRDGSSGSSGSGGKGSLDKGIPAGGDAPGAERKWYQRAGDIVKGAFKGRGKAVAGVVTGVLVAGGLYAAFSGNNAIEMDPADLAELQKHLKVIDQYGKDPEIIKGLPQDVQTRLSALVKNLEKLKNAKAKAPAAAPAPAGNPEFGGT